MPNYVTIVVDDAARYLNAGMYDAGAVVRLESSATQTGVYVSEGTAALVAGTELYVIYDTNGTSSTWYRTRYENSGGTVTSDYSVPFQVGDLSTAYASHTTFHAFIRNQGVIATDADSDLEILALEAAARAIDRECGRNFRVAGAVSARVFTAGPSTYDTTRYAVDVDDFATATGLVVAFDATGNGSYTTATTAYRPGPVNAPSAGHPYRSLLFDLGVVPPLNEYGVQVTAAWGWPSVPAAVSFANLLQASRFLKRRDSPFGVAGSPELGNELRLLAKLDPDVAILLRDYKLDWGFA